MALVRCLICITAYIAGSTNTQHHTTMLLAAEARKTLLLGVCARVRHFYRQTA